MINQYRKSCRIKNIEKYIQINHSKFKLNIRFKAKMIKNEKTNPINPDTSTKEKPIKVHLTKMFDKTGFLAIPNTKDPKTNPTPTATPDKEIKGRPEDKYRNPDKIIRFWMTLNRSN